MKELKIEIIENLTENKRHPKCKGIQLSDIGNGSDYNCGYNTSITCDECKYCGGRKNPEAKCNSIK